MPEPLGGAPSPPDEPLCWDVHPTCSPEWMDAAAHSGGGFFHSPAALQVSLPLGEPAFATLRAGEKVVGVALGVWSRCRLSLKRRHFYAPSLPALVHASLEPPALAAWREYLSAVGAADVVIDSFDSRWARRELLAGQPERQEYVVALDGGAGVLARKFSDTHRRHLRRGEAEGWTLRALAGSDARAALEAVQSAAVGRATLRGDVFDSRLPSLSVLDAEQATLAASCGARTHGVWHGAELLAAALVGWAHRRAYYLLGGSTPEGYRRSAAVWLHWRVMALFAQQGFTAYNLGGTAAAAVAEGDHGHGLFRFKSGFRGEIVPCRGAHWELRRAHAKYHRLAHRLSAGVLR